MTKVDSANLSRGFLVILVGDVLVLTLLALLVAGGTIRLYPTAMIACLIFFAVNILLAWALTRKHAKESARRESVPSYLWFAAGVFTPAAIVAVMAFFMEPSVPHATGAVAAILLLSYIWYLIHGFRRIREPHASSTDRERTRTRQPEE